MFPSSSSNFDVRPRARLALTALLASLAAACGGPLDAETSSAALSPADRAAAAVETASAFVDAQRSAGRFVPSSQLLINGDGFFILQDVNEDFTSGVLAGVGALYDRNDWLRVNNDGSATIHFLSNEASSFYLDLATGAVAFGDGASMRMNFSGGLLQWGSYYYVDFFEPFTSFNFHGTGRVQFDGVGPLSTLTVHASSRPNGQSNQFVRLN
ncbi:hypothetical protein L6R52_02095 [Myxococcota bacterium]|nr:hypothetical protein [Myxococcota bacterium]